MTNELSGNIDKALECVFTSECEQNYTLFADLINYKKNVGNKKMDAVASMAGQLGIDQSLFQQLGVAIVIFLLSHFLFMDKLYEVLARRESKTTGLKKEIDKKRLHLEKLIQKYKEDLDKVYKLSSEKKEKKLHEVREKIQNELKSLENEMGKEVEQEIEKLSAMYKKVQSDLAQEEQDFSRILISRLHQ